MGPSAREIEEQIKETRERIDENLVVLENRATSNAVRYVKMAAIVFGAAAVAGAGWLIVRRMRRPTLKDRLARITPDSLRALVDEVASRLKKPLPTVKVTVNERSREPGTVTTILREVAPAMVGTVSTAVVERLARPSRNTRSPAH